MDLFLLLNKFHRPPVGQGRGGSGAYPANTVLKVPKGGFWSFQILYNYTETMSSVNSAACLLARNHFYQNISPTNKIQTVYSFPGRPSHARQMQVTVWKTASSHQGLPGQKTRRRVLSLVWKSSLSSPVLSKQIDSANHVIK
ncbi:hypothetical protein AMELA_G00197080 [Ameiurus melas]|uniref:Uncharacterized protein n=1 Tax=Ameiurus melas TaxID=219545 RepID=A0A7J6A9Y1_AMEME|nr:hypothetical protein AMELA_G00197080 [Ameiurus melas]